jgi:hypothetical protein
MWFRFTYFNHAHIISNSGKRNANVNMSLGSIGSVELLLFELKTKISQNLHLVCILSIAAEDTAKRFFKDGLPK